MIDKKRYTVVIHTRITPSVWDKLEKICETMSLKPSELIRSILEEYLE